jgi:hypothetical protein
MALDASLPGKRKEGRTEVAYAALYEEPLEGVEGKCYRVEANPFDAEPYRGPADRDWDDFDFSEDGGSFAYRSAPDRIREIAQAVVARKRRLAKALEDPVFGLWYGKLEDKYDMTVRDDRDTVREILADIAAGKISAADQEKPWSYYLFESEEFLHEPLELLPLPPWAKHEYVMDGGPGSGFDAAFLVLDPGKTLADLAAWLEEQGRKRKVRRSPRAP